MQYVPLGKSGFKVSRFGMGCMRLPLEESQNGTTPPSQVDEDEAVRMIRHAVDNGVTYFDSAYGYHADMLKDRSRRRHLPRILQYRRRMGPTRRRGRDSDGAECVYRDGCNFARL